METVKLYIGSCMGDLNKKSIYNFDSSRSTKIHINHSEKAFQAAEEARLKGDEERSYILYMRYIEIFQKVRNSPAFKKDESHYSLLLGTSKLRDALSNAEKLSESLRKRYDGLIKSSTGRAVVAMQSGKSQPSSTEPESDAKTDNPISVVRINNVHTRPQFISADAKSISCEKLYELLFSKNETDCKVLLIDLRHREEFTSSRIRHSACINIPRTVIKPGTVCKRIESEIKEEKDLQAWKQRGQVDLIVIIDWRSKVKDLVDLSNPSRSLIDALAKWEQEIFLRHNPVILTGGFSDWLDYYPQFTTNPKTKPPPPQSGSGTNLSGLSDFSFADLIIPEVRNGDPDVGDISNLTTFSQNAENDIEPSPTSADLIKGTLPTPPVPPVLARLDINLHSEIKNSDIANSADSKREQIQLNDFGSTTKEWVKGITPMVDRTTKPAVQKPPQVSTRPIIDENGLNSRKTHISDNDRAVAEIENRLNASKKKKELEESKTKELDEKRKLIELQALEKRMQMEAEQGELRRKTAEKELANAMRKLRKGNTEYSSSNDASSTLDEAGSGLKVDENPAAKQTVGPVFSKNMTTESQPSQTLGNSQKIEVTGKPGVEKNTMKEKGQTDANQGKRLPVRPEHSSKPVSIETDHSSKPGKKATEEKSDENPFPEPVKPSGAFPEPVKPSGAFPEPVKPAETVSPPSRPLQKPTSVAGKSAEKPPSKPQNSSDSVVTADSDKPSGATASAPSRQKPNSVTGKSAEKPPSKPPKSSDSVVVPGSEKTSGAGAVTLPLNWEKRLDKPTGRYFYLDHRTKTTHWRLPENAIPSVRTVSRKKIPGGSSLKRSSSSPNIAQLVESEKNESAREKPLVPSRQFKPTSLQDDLYADQPDEYANRLARLHPASGGNSPGLCGLQNLGNTCYMNSVLQCMFNTTLLARYFLTNEYKRDINRNNFLGSGGEITDGFAVLMKAAWNGQFKHLMPREFRLTISKFNTRFSGYSQQDSQELLLFLMDGLHEDLNLITDRKYEEEKENDNLRDIEAAKYSWEYHKRLNKSIIVELFQGQFKATVQCVHCKKTSRKFDVFMYLSLPLPAQSCSIYECIKKFSEVEKLSGDNKWRCPSCKTERDAVRKMEIWKLPPVLLIHFKRFSFCGRWGDKVETNVKFPANALDLSSYVKGPNAKKKYELYSVSHHHGASLDSGHYVASCKSPLDNNWYKYDDHEVSRTQVPQGPSSYILCYTSLAHSLDLVKT